MRPLRFSDLPGVQGFALPTDPDAPLFEFNAWEALIMGINARVRAHSVEIADATGRVHTVIVGARDDMIWWNAVDVAPRGEPSNFNRVAIGDQGPLLLAASFGEDGADAFSTTRAEDSGTINLEVLRAHAQRSLQSGQWGTFFCLPLVRSQRARLPLTVVARDGRAWVGDAQSLMMWGDAQWMPVSLDNAGEWAALVQNGTWKDVGMQIFEEGFHADSPLVQAREWSAPDSSEALWNCLCAPAWDGGIPDLRRVLGEIFRLVPGAWERDEVPSLSVRTWLHAQGSLELVVDARVRGDKAGEEMVIPETHRALMADLFFLARVRCARPEELKMAPQREWFRRQLAEADEAPDVPQVALSVHAARFESAHDAAESLARLREKLRGHHNSIDAQSVLVQLKELL